MSDRSDDSMDSSSLKYLLHLKDQFGNDRYFGSDGDVRLAALANVQYSGILEKIRHTPLHPDDVIVVGYPKSGNNWIHHMVSMLKAGTTQLPPMFEEDNFNFLDSISCSQKLPPPDKPRVFISHLPLRFLPRDVEEKKVKIVYVTRNPKDVFVSLYCHLSKVKIPLGYQGSWSQFFSVMLDDGWWYGSVFDHLKDWQNEMDSHPDLPIFNCNYEDTKRDTLGQLERLNQFLETGRERQLIEKIASTCQLGNMHVTRAQKDETWLNVWQWKDNAPFNQFYRKGIVGDWKNWFTVAQNKQFDDVYAAKMADYRRNFQFE